MTRKNAFLLTFLFSCSAMMASVEQYQQLVESRAKDKAFLTKALTEPHVGNIIFEYLVDKDHDLAQIKRTIYADMDCEIVEKIATIFKLYAVFKPEYQSQNWIKDYQFVSEMNFLHVVCDTIFPFNDVRKELYEKRRCLMIETLYSNQIDINAGMVYGCTPIYYAAQNDSSEAIAMLYTFGADINQQNDNGWTPLHKAAWCGSFKAVKMLLDLNADITIHNCYYQLAEQMTSTYKPGMRNLFAQAKIDREKQKNLRLAVVQELNNYQHKTDATAFTCRIS